MTVVALRLEHAARLVSLRMQDVIRIELNENSTTGYLWSLSSAALADFEIVADGREVSDQPGGRAVRWFVLRPRRQERLSLEMILRRPWEDDEISRRVFHIAVIS